MSEVDESVESADSTSSDCALIIDRRSQIPLAEIAPVVARHLGIDVHDARCRLRYGGGIVVERAAHDTAEAIAEELRSLGVGTQRVEPTQKWPKAKTHNAVSIEVLSDSLLAGTAAGASLVFDLRQIVGFHLHGYPPPSPERPDHYERRWDRFQNRRAPEDASHVRLALEGASALAADSSGLSSTTRTLLERMREAELERMSIHLTLYCIEEGRPARIRLGKDSTDYSVLGDRKSDHSLENFLTIVEDLIDAVPTAWNRDSLQSFLDDPDPTSILHFKREETENYDRWLLQWVQLEYVGSESRPGGGA